MSGGSSGHGTRLGFAAAGPAYAMGGVDSHFAHRLLAWSVVVVDCVARHVCRLRKVLAERRPGRPAQSAKIAYRSQSALGVGKVWQNCLESRGRSAG
jgi:hypothetical protein